MKALVLASFSFLLSAHVFADGLDAILGSSEVEAKQETVSAEKTIPETYIEQVVKSLEDNYGLVAEKNFGDSYCPNSKYCEALVGPIQIQAIGFSVDALTSTRAEPSDYLKVCSAIFQALSGAEINMVEATVLNAFNQASKSGRVSTKLGNTDFTVTPQSNGLLQCKTVLMRR